MATLLIFSFVRYIPLRKINFGAIILSLSSNSFVYSSTEPLKLLIRFYLRVQSYILFVMFIEAAQNICYWFTWQIQYQNKNYYSVNQIPNYSTIFAKNRKSLCNVNIIINIINY